MPGGQCQGVVWHCPPGPGSCPDGEKILRAVVTRRKLQNAQRFYLPCRRIVVISQLTDFLKETKPGEFPLTQCIPWESLAVRGEMVRRRPAVGISPTAPIAGPKAHGVPASRSGPVGWPPSLVGLAGLPGGGWHQVQAAALREWLGTWPGCSADGYGDCRHGSGTL